MRESTLFNSCQLPTVTNCWQFFTSVLNIRKSNSSPFPCLLYLRLITTRCQPVFQNWGAALNFGKCPLIEKWHHPLKITLFEGVQINFGHQFFSSASAIYVACVFCKENWQKSAKYDRGSCSKKTLPRIGGHHLVPSLSSFQQRNRYSNVLNMPWQFHQVKTICLDWLNLL